jgi:hypothetical protein
MRQPILSVALALAAVESGAFGAETPTSTSPEAKDIANPAHSLDLARVHLKYGDPARAEPLLRSALEKSTEAPQRDAITQALIDTRMRVADQALRKRDYAGAVAVANTVLIEFKDNADATARATALIKRADHEKTRQGSEIKPESPEKAGADVKPVPPGLARSDMVPPPPAAPDAKTPSTEADKPKEAQATEGKPSVTLPPDPPTDKGK